MGVGGVGRLASPEANQCDCGLARAAAAPSRRDEITRQITMVNGCEGGEGRSLTLLSSFQPFLFPFDSLFLFLDQ